MSPPESVEWPELPYAAWKDTCDTLHLWTQIVGKIRLVQTPWLNHSWHVALYVTARGLTTSPIPYHERAFQIDFDFFDHVLWIRTSDGNFRQLLLRPMPVAQFYAELFAAMAEIGLDVRITTMPCEIADPIPFDQDDQHAAYDRRLCRALLAHTPLGARSSRTFPYRLPRQGEPRPFLLGELRPGGHALFREARTTPSRRRALSTRRCRSGGIFTRGFERGLLAWRGRAGRLCGFLLLRLSGSTGFRPRPRAAGPGVLLPGIGRIHPAV